ncbi:hypothetical protein Q7P37_000380 [Cladosporium fusiforme]
MKPTLDTLARTRFGHASATWSGPREKHEQEIDTCSQTWVPCGAHILFELAKLIWSPEQKTKQLVEQANTQSGAWPIPSKGHMWAPEICGEVRAYMYWWELVGEMGAWEVPYTGDVTTATCSFNTMPTAPFPSSLQSPFIAIHEE